MARIRRARLPASVVASWARIIAEDFAELVQRRQWGRGSKESQRATILSL